MLNELIVELTVEEKGGVKLIIPQSERDIFIGILPPVLL